MFLKTEPGVTKSRMVTAVVDKVIIRAAASAGSIGIMTVVVGGYPVGKGGSAGSIERVISGRVLLRAVGWPP